VSGQNFVENKKNKKFCKKFIEEIFDKTPASLEDVDYSEE
jgi:hypothetical protein